MTRTTYCVIFLSVAATHFIVLAVRPTNLYCDGSTLHDLRIQGCDEQPCKIRKGERLPFEIDLSFEKEIKSADRFTFDVFNPYYSAPPMAYGDSISRANCEEGSVGFDCPIRPHVKYTLKHFLFIDSTAVCTAGCNNTGPGGTGDMRKTDWGWTILNSQVRDFRATCDFQITLDITDN